jgi:hypothetical protein
VLRRGDAPFHDNLDTWARPVFPPEVKQFIASCVRSVWALELLLLLRRDDRRAWSVEDLTTELRSSTFVVADVLATFRQAGLVAQDPDGKFRYAPAASHLDRAVEQIASAYAIKPLAVSKEILASGNDKIRTFADAFRLKKD